MDQTLKLIIADDEELICQMLEQIIDFDRLGLELVGKAFDGETLFSLIQELGPDIVVTDIRMPKMDGLEIIKRTRQKGMKCKFVIISGYRQFNYAYNALKYDVEDYILKPVDQEELGAALEKIAGSLRSGTGGAGNNGVLQQYFIKKAVAELEAKPLPLEELNRSYATGFRQGPCRVVLARIDYADKKRQINEDATSLLSKIRNLLGEVFRPLCHEMILEEKADGVQALLNYGGELEDQVRTGVKELYTRVKNITDLFSGLYITVCASATVVDVNQAWRAVSQAGVCEWARMAYGINKVIWYDELAPDSPYTLGGKLEELEHRTRAAYEVLDPEGFGACMEEFFVLPESMLCREECMDFAQNIFRLFFDLYEEKIAPFTDPDALYNKISRMLRFCTRYPAYRDTLVSQLGAVMESIKENISKQNSRPVRLAYAYVQQHYGRRISLEDVAGEVFLNPVYFSNLFKKETGQTFSDYVIAYRMQVAKEMLKSGEKNIAEIAAALSFTDARYFSKLFKKVVGIKPSEYRKIYG